MKTFLCKLVRQGLLVDTFYRKGESVEAVRAQLELFHWPKGQWVITEV